jgi:hypothetical protein
LIGEKWEGGSEGACGVGEGEADPDGPVVDTEETAHAA